MEKTELAFYKNKEKRLLRPELFSKTADAWAEKLAGDQKSKNKKNRRSQLRRFYDEILRLNAICKESRGAKDPHQWDRIFPYVHMLIAKAAYARGRNLVTDDFVEFLQASVDQIKEPADLDVFANFFEAMMAFYRNYRNDN